MSYVIVENLEDLSENNSLLDALKKGALQAQMAQELWLRFGDLRDKPLSEIKDLYFSDLLARPSVKSAHLQALGELLSFFGLALKTRQGPMGFVMTRRQAERFLGASEAYQEGFCDAVDVDRETLGAWAESVMKQHVECDDASRASDPCGNRSANNPLPS